MGFMDKVRSTAQDVASGAKKATVQGKSKLDQLQTRRKADEAAKQLGYLIHAERTSGTPAGAEAERLVAEITSLEAEIARAEAEARAAADQAAAATPGASAASEAPPPPTSPGPTPGDSQP